MFEILSSVALGIFCLRQWAVNRNLMRRVKGLELIHGWKGEKLQAFMTVQMRDAHNWPL
jgi:hypothetical protein